METFFDIVLWIIYTLVILYAMGMSIMFVSLFYNITLILLDEFYLRDEKGLFKKMIKKFNKRFFI